MINKKWYLTIFKLFENQLKFAAHVTKIVEERLPLFLNDSVVDFLYFLKSRLEIRFGVCKSEIKRLLQSAYYDADI